MWMDCGFVTVIGRAVFKIRNPQSAIRNH